MLDIGIIMSQEVGMLSMEHLHSLDMYFTHIKLVLNQ